MSKGYPTSPCKGCMRPVIWVQTAEGTRIPLDPSAPVYSIHLGEIGQPLIGVRRPEFHVSHFSTCPKANDFSRRSG